jgi:hypothetical protein
MKGLIDKSMGIRTRIAEALARIKPTEPLRSTIYLPEEDLFKREIEDLPVVKSLSFIREIGRNKAGYRVNLFCDAVSLYGGCKD